MRQILALLMCGALFVAVGCKSDNGNDGGSRTTEDPKMMSQDACPKCAGVQKMTADGRCPECGMKASKTSADACPHCAGAQKATADGKCPVCGMKM
ncbi:MAG: hypothetical protein ACREIT_01905 [Tepidisphaeraceae bacterium]